MTTIAEATLAEATAEWICTRCGATNRRLVPAGGTRATDACYSCHAKHEIEREDRPVRWKARLKG